MQFRATQNTLNQFRVQFIAIQGNSGQFKAIQSDPGQLTEPFRAIQGNSMNFRAIHGNSILIHCNSHSYIAIQGNTG